MSGKYDAALDVEGYIFQTHEQEAVIKGQTIFNPITKCYSCVYHGNGGDDAKAKLRQLWSALTAHEKYIQVQDHKVIGPDMLLIDFMSEDLCKEWIALSEKHGG